MTPGGWTLLIVWALLTVWITGLLDTRIRRLERAATSGSSAAPVALVDEPPTDELEPVRDTVIAHPASTRLRRDELLRPTPYPRAAGRHRAEP